MKTDKYDKYALAAREGTIPDSENPLFVFSMTSTKLLVMAVHKQIDLMELARMELAARGLNKKGEWVGMREASEQLKKSMTKKPKGPRL
ncbi:hypothetical protein SAMN04488511_1168 [Pedobacter suwonensis]|uniref:Uncharacterized protein n=1 Tax=Pedobacter suwonensis TaxID=332999 RepID=A0A1I0TXQ4_9SPHI|nr:hypothetical protein [Pedobacter suwonensis]SFA56457.1 hypothetical protein SAMN04488511_1168 [Pedobacter suwonensis]